MSSKTKTKQSPDKWLERSPLGTRSGIVVGQAFRPDSYHVRPESLTYMKVRSRDPGAATATPGY